MSQTVWCWAVVSFQEAHYLTIESIWIAVTIAPPVVVAAGTRYALALFYDAGSLARMNIGVLAGKEGQAMLMPAEHHT